jgi:hypothetical protein
VAGATAAAAAATIATAITIAIAKAAFRFIRRTQDRENSGILFLDFITTRDFFQPGSDRPTIIKLTGFFLAAASIHIYFNV